MIFGMMHFPCRHALILLSDRAVLAQRTWWRWTFRPVNLETIAPPPQSPGHLLALLPQDAINRLPKKFSIILGMCWVRSEVVSGADPARIDEISGLLAKQWGGGIRVRPAKTGRNTLFFGLSDSHLLELKSLFQASPRQIVDIQPLVTWLSTLNLNPLGKTAPWFALEEPGALTVGCIHARQIEQLQTFRTGLKDISPSEILARASSRRSESAPPVIDLCSIGVSALQLAAPWQTQAHHRLAC